MLELVFLKDFSWSKSKFFASRRQANLYSFDFIYDLDFVSEEFSLLPIDCEILVNVCSSAQNIAINAEM